MSYTGPRKPSSLFALWCPYSHRLVCVETRDAYSCTATRPNCFLFETAASLRKIPLGSDVIYWQAPVSLNPPTLFATSVWRPTDDSRPRCSNSTSLPFPFRSAAFGSSVTRSWRHYPIGRCTRLFSCLDYCNAMLAGLPDATLAPLQRVLHTYAARLVNNVRPGDHVTSATQGAPLVADNPASRVEYKLCLFVH